MFTGICYELNGTISNSQVPSTGKQITGRFVQLLSKGEVRNLFYLIDHLPCFYISYKFLSLTTNLTKSFLLLHLHIARACKLYKLPSKIFPIISFRKRIKTKIF